jgi:hypothetical protein
MIGAIGGGVIIHPLLFAIATLALVAFFFVVADFSTHVLGPPIWLARPA